MTFELTIMTCPPRKDVCDETVRQFKASDWGDDVKVVEDTLATKADNAHDRTMDAVLYILKQFAKGDKDYLIFCEDDIDVNQHFRHNVENWWPVKHDLLDMGSFYNPNVDSHYVDREKHYSLAKPEAFYGSQCIILSRRAVAWVLKNWDTWPARETGTFQDILISRIVAGAHWPIYQHIPSLAEHRSVPSTYGGTVHRSVDYDETFKFIKEGKQNG